MLKKFPFSNLGLGYFFKLIYKESHLDRANIEVIARVNDIKDPQKSLVSAKSLGFVITDSQMKEFCEDPKSYAFAWQRFTGRK